MIKIGKKYSPALDNVLDFNGNKIEHIEILEKDKDVKGNFKVLIYPKNGFCSVDSISKQDLENKFKIIS